MLIWTSTIASLFFCAIESVSISWMIFSNQFFMQCTFNQGSRTDLLRKSQEITHSLVAWIHNKRTVGQRQDLNFVFLLYVGLFSYNRKAWLKVDFLVAKLPYNYLYPSVCPSDLGETRFSQPLLKQTTSFFVAHSSYK